MRRKRRFVLGALIAFLPCLVVSADAAIPATASHSDLVHAQSAARPSAVTVPTASATPTPATTDVLTPITKPIPSTTATTSTPTVTPSVAKPQKKSIDCAVDRCVALTFDDGPGPYTGKLLDSLKKEGVHATFFVIGASAANHPDLVKRELAEGHTVGNHTWSHQQLTKLSPVAAAAEEDRASTVLESLTGKRPMLFRPPYGSYIAGHTPHNNMAVIMWNIDTQDWKNKNVEITTERALTGVKPGSIILFHDVHPTTVEAIPGVIAKLRAQGFVLVTIPQLFDGDVKPGVVYFSRQ